MCKVNSGINDIKRKKWRTVHLYFILHKILFNHCYKVNYLCPETEEKGEHQSL